ncbi:hypothetical protein CLM62_38475 [Streptomyces sp. SA15]|nr:hypothetical protein CLM62_38475 [Streptomyces sp. SA15]
MHEVTAGDQQTRGLRGSVLASTSSEIHPATEPITLPSGGPVILIALLLPVFMMLLMLALEAFENLLFPPAEPPRQPGRVERSRARRNVESGGS